jgi:hypothetical protein
MVPGASYRSEVPPYSVNKLDEAVTNLSKYKDSILLKKVKKIIDFRGREFLESSSLQVQSNFMQLALFISCFYTYSVSLKEEFTSI